MRKLLILICIFAVISCGTSPDPFTTQKELFTKAADNARLATEAFSRCQHFIQGWLNHTDPETGLIPRNLTRNVDIWNAKDAAADNYPFMVLTAAITDSSLFHGRMLDMLKTETKLTSRVGHLPDTYSFTKNGFDNKDIKMGDIIFGGSEYVKDGLLPLTEWLGHSPWSERMINILDDIWENAPVETKYGRIPSTSQEVNGEMLQTLSRIYWMTGEKKYLESGIRLADYYLFDHHPTRNEERIRLRDHGCEILSGLTEIYATVHYAAPEKKKAYQEPIYAMLDKVLEFGSNEHGLFYNWVNPTTGEHDEKLGDNYGYTYNGFYTVYLIDKKEEYRQAVQFALANLNEHYREYLWEGSGSADGDADATEGALNLYNREPVESAAIWIDNQMQVMWSKQQDDGVIEGWHGDGNFARTSIMYALWKTKGLTIKPWRQDVRVGAEMLNDELYINLQADKSWNGRLVFDVPRHKVNMQMPLDYPRINQFPEWFTVKNDATYSIRISKKTGKTKVSGQDLIDGMPVELDSGEELLIVVK